MEVDKEMADEFLKAIEKWVRNKTWLANAMMLDKATFSLMIRGRIPITDASRRRLNEILGTSIGDKFETND